MRFKNKHNLEILTRIRTETISKIKQIKNLFTNDIKLIRYKNVITFKILSILELFLRKIPKINIFVLFKINVFKIIIYLFTL